MAAYIKFVLMLVLTEPKLIFGISYIDLSYPVGQDTPLWPALQKVRRNEEHFEKDSSDWLASSYFSMSEHSSTHIDAPYHVSPIGWKLSEIPVNRFFNVSGVMIDMSYKITKQNPPKRNYAIQKEDILEWERKFGRIPQESIVLIRTGWGEKFLKDPEDFIGAQKKCCSYPSLGLSSAKLFSERGARGVGVDVVSLDVGYTSTFPVHSYLGSRNIFLLENVANLHILPPKGFNLFFFPLKLDGSSGSPIRIFASVN